jgi:hypothetical protein
MTDDNLITVTLSGEREFRGKPMAPQAWVLVFDANPMPVEPKDEQVNEAGVTIYLSVPPDDPRAIAYVDAIRDYNRALEEAGWLNFFADTLKVPKDFDIPTGHKRLGVKLADDPLDRLIQYIRLEVIQSTDDAIALDAAIRGEITESEVDAAAALFPGDEE